MNNTSLPVIVVGSANVDFSTSVMALPKSGDTVFGTGLARTPGGKGLNQAVALHRAGAHTKFVFSVGDDSEAAFLREFITQEGLSSEVLVSRPYPTGRAFIFVDALGENQIVVLPGANLSTDLADVDIDDGEGYLVLQLEIGYDSNLALAKKARRAGRQVVLTPAPVSELSLELLGFVDILVLNEAEAMKVSGRKTLSTASEKLRELVGTVVITLGARGSAIYAPGYNGEMVPAPEVSALDTTGAGDTFCGYLVATLAQGASLKVAAEFASSAAALAVQRPGAASGVPTFSEVRAQFLS